MCGICGKVFFNRAESVDPSLIRDMATTMHHRGPDGEGTYVKQSIGLGHRRLSIIDLGGGAQPIANEDGTVWIVFNGEIYNYLELRERLLQYGHVFKTNSDTEVIVHAYEQYGADCVSHLRGMFAFAIWDEKDRTLFLARDRVGIKPLYYSVTSRSLVFASEVKALLADQEVPRSISSIAIGRFFTHYYTAGDETPFEGVKKLPPGSTLTVRDGSVAIKQYWDLRFSRERLNLNLQEAALQVTERLKEAVRLHMISDVPVGFLLSGGVDSTALLSLAVKETGKRVASFTIGFDGHRFADERPFAKLAALHFGTSHYDLTINSRQFADFLPKYVWHMEELVCEPPAIALFYVSQLAAQHVKVLISGEGGDEAFAGYPQYRSVPLFEGVRGVMAPFEPILTAATTAYSLPRVSRYTSLLRYGFEDYYLSRSSNPLTWFNRGSGRDLAEVVRPLHEDTRRLDLVSRMLYVDTKTWLPDDLLVKADKMTMANSVELRVPLLDHELLEFAATLPSELKVRGRETKRVLKTAFRGLIPPEIIKRKKTGFPVPYDTWLRGELRPFAEEILLDRRSVQRGYFSRKNMEKLLADHASGKDCSKEVFSLLVLEIWNRSFMDR
jgi:asparagine synthase (glutamine-hydrolysing)